MMVDFPVPTPVFHITAIDNLRNIAQAGGLLSKNLATRRRIASANIAYEQIQGRRAVKAVPIGPGGTLHDYVPFYFAPRSPMLMTINTGNVPGCNYRQSDIAHLCTSAQTLAVGPESFVFTDFHAALEFSKFFDDLEHLDKIQWPLLLEPPLLGGYCKYWQNKPNPARYLNRRESRQAEFLVHNRVATGTINIIGVHTAAAAAKVRAALGGTRWNPEIRVVPEWYY